MLLRVAEPKRRIGGAERNRTGSSVEQWQKSSKPWPNISNPRKPRRRTLPCEMGTDIWSIEPIVWIIHELLRLELPIGSGLIESGHRHVLQARLKKAGAAWLVENADEIANLRVLRANGDWLSLWN